MSLHIGAAAGDIAPIVLMPGDPYRARWAAETFLESPRLVNEVRGMLGYTGHWRGREVTIHGSGMGMPSMGIYAHELIADHGARCLIRIGSAGAMREDVRVRDIVLAMTASSVSAPSAPAFHGAQFAPCADWDLLARANEAARARGARAHVGGVYSSDAFYDERPEIGAALARHGVLAVEMETAELYAVAARHGARALAVLTISDHLLTHEALPAEARERSFGEMVEIALEAGAAAA